MKHYWKMAFKSNEWGRWNNLSSYKRGELAGYAFGKNGADILLPGCAVKAVAKGAGAAKNLGVICKNLKAAERTLVLEAAAEASLAGVNVGEVVISAERTMVAAEELGLAGKEISALQEAGTLKQQIGKGRDYHAGNPEKQVAYDRITNAQNGLAPYVKQPMPEIEARNLIHQYGIQTFPRPAGIPEHYLVQITGKGAGMEYVNPHNIYHTVRVMPGKPHSSFPHQQNPYVIQMKHGKAFDKNGNLVSHKSPEAHVSINDFVFRD